MTALSETGLRAPSADDFLSSGYAVLPGLLAEKSLASARRDADAVVAAPSEVSCERPHNTLVPLRWCDPLAEVAVIAAPRVAAAVGARDLRWISGYVSVKDPDSPPLWWHQDWWAWDHPISLSREPTQVALLCYLSDTSVTSGALRVIPGSHHGNVDLHGLLPQAHSDEATALDFDHPAMTDHARQVTLAVSAGDAVVTDYRLLHGTHPNSSPRRRDCVLLTFAPHWSELPAEVRGHLIQHPALPTDTETPDDAAIRGLLPSYDGPRVDLTVNRHAPTSFTVASPA